LLHPERASKVAAISAVSGIRCGVFIVVAPALNAKERAPSRRTLFACGEA
jgi:hypothetical protein